MTRLDFGNGVWADTTGGESGIGKDATGLEVPDYDVASSENTVLDGGTVGGSRAKMRRMVIPVEHNRLWDRRDIMRRFTSGPVRVLSSDLGCSMPYVVARLSFPDSLIEARRRFTVVALSPLAFPEGGPRQASTPPAAGGGLTYPKVYPIHYNSLPAATSLGLESGSESPFTPCCITLVMAVAAADVAITIGSRTTTITGALSIGDKVEIDSRVSPHTVLVNGVNRLAWFGKTGKFPMLEPGYNLVAWTRNAIVTVEWSPRMLGLI